MKSRNFLVGLSFIAAVLRPQISAAAVGFDGTDRPQIISVASAGQDAPAPNKIPSAPAALLKHPTCTITPPYEPKIADALKAKGFEMAAYEYYYQVNGRGPVQHVAMSLENDSLVSRADIHYGREALQAKLSALRYDSMKIRVYDAAGKQIADHTETVHDAYTQERFDMNDTDVVRASLVFLLERAAVKTASQAWYEMEFSPIYEGEISKSESFTLRSLAENILAHSSGESDLDTEALQIIAGRKTADALTAPINNDALEAARMTLIESALGFGKISAEEMMQKEIAAIPECRKIKQ